MITVSTLLSIFLISFNPKNHHMKQILLLILIGQQNNGGLKSLTIICKVTQTMKVADP